MTVGYHEHMRNLEVGDELLFRMERLVEAMDISPTKKNALRAKQAAQELNDYTDRMNELYELNKKAA